MQKKTKKLVRATGLVALSAMMAMNFTHAFNNYGIITNQLSSPILGQNSTGNETTSGTSSSTNDENKHCKQMDSRVHIQDQCSLGSRNRDCDYYVSSWWCKKGNEYWCKEGSITSGHDCNTEFNSSNQGTVTVRDCK